MIKICENCNKEFKSNKMKQKYCNKQCKDGNRTKRRKKNRQNNYIKNCKNCKNIFMSNKYNKNFCSKICFNVYYKYHNSTFNRQCKRCTADYTTTYSEKIFCSNKCANLYHKEKRRIRLKKEILLMYGNSCACCGEDNILLLTVDHINNDGKKHRTLVHNDLTRYKEILMEYRPDLYQILCMNCNWGRYQHGICPHKMEIEKCNRL